jgi:hypothetical protein
MRRTPVPHPVPTPIPSDSAEDMSPDLPFEEGAHDTLNPDLRHRMISEAAFYLHAQRGYREGYDLDDWLEAEARIDHFLLNPQRDDVEYTDGLA